jgi:hypothetical protein
MFRLSTAFALAALAWATTAPAANTDSDLGQAWPRAQDVSRSPHWHVYVFDKQGIRYIQINDLNGRVRAAFATAGGELFVLPMGTDAAHVHAARETRTASTTTVQPSSSETIYSDDTLSVEATPLSNGALDVSATTLTACNDPLECGAKIN